MLCNKRGGLSPTNNMLVNGLGLFSCDPKHGGSSLWHDVKLPFPVIKWLVLLFPQIWLGEYTTDIFHHRRDGGHDFF